MQHSVIIGRSVDVGKMVQRLKNVVIGETMQHLAKQLQWSQPYETTPILSYKLSISDSEKHIRKTYIFHTKFWISASLYSSFHRYYTNSNINGIILDILAFQF